MHAGPAALVLCAPAGGGGYVGMEERAHVPGCDCTAVYTTDLKVGKHDLRSSPSISPLLFFGLMHAWNTRASPCTVATLGSVVKFLTKADLLAELWLHAPSACA